MQAEGKVNPTGELAVEKNPATPSMEEAVVKDGDVVIRVHYKDGKINTRIVANTVYGPDSRNSSGEWRVHERELEPLRKALDELLERHSHRALQRSRQHAAASYNAATQLGEYPAATEDAEEGAD